MVPEFIFGGHVMNISMFVAVFFAVIMTLANTVMPNINTSTGKNADDVVSGM